MKLILLRHAKAQKASWDVPDRDRPLQERGHRQTIQLAQYLPGPLAMDPAVSWTIWCSPALRTRQTLEGWQQHTLSKSAWDGLYHPQRPDWLYLADAERLESERLLLDEAMNLLVIGHNNGLSDWADSLLGQPQPPLRTCQLLVLQSPSKNESGVHWRIEQSWIADQEDSW